MTEAEARSIYHQGEEAVVSKLMEFDTRLKRLEEIINMNSGNSSKPPSTDNKFKNRNKKAKSSSNKKRGGQKGHEGKSLKIVSNPDVVEHLFPKTCECCKEVLESEESVQCEKRQVFDLPEVKMEIKEYQAHSIRCSGCKSITKASFPKGIKTNTQYGANLKSFVSYLNVYQMLPYERIVEMIEDLSSHKIGRGSIYNFLNTQYEQLESFETCLKASLLKEKVLHSDETGIKIKGKLHWVHIVSSSRLSYYMPHEKRGRIAMDEMEILPKYQGILVHDHWRPYNHYLCKHSYCNAHILRELNAVTEKENFLWSEGMHKLLTRMNNSVHKAKEEGKNHLSAYKLKFFSRDYKKIIQSAEKYYPPATKQKNPIKGRPKQEKGKNLLDRLVKYQTETLLFSYNFFVPFTNNLAERDLRMIKVKEKISGSFASFHGAEIFSRIKSYISTLKKNNLPILQGLKNALEGKTYLPIFAVG